MALLSRDATSVGVFGGDPVVGRALEQLLRSAGYSARFLTEASFQEPQTLDGLQLLLFAGGLDASRRESFVAVLREAGKANLPVLELVSSLQASRDGAQGALPWPCRVEELRERIEKTLLDGSHPHREEANDG